MERMTYYSLQYASDLEDEIEEAEVAETRDIVEVMVNARQLID